uniref:FBD domain-containing protein n=1 Tax=Chenopodium quinoa TaxID=63459 RepID=A0A803LYG8_CHEQI
MVERFFDGGSTNSVTTVAVQPQEGCCSTSDPITLLTGPPSWYIDDYDDEGIKKFFAAFHHLHPLPIAVIIDDFGDFFLESKCQMKYNNPRGRDLAMVRVLALCHSAIIHASKTTACQLLLSDTYHGDFPRQFIYKRWISSIFTVQGEGDGSGSFLLKHSVHVQGKSIGKRSARYSIALQYLDNHVATVEVDVAKHDVCTISGIVIILLLSQMEQTAEIKTLHEMAMRGIQIEGEDRISALSDTLLCIILSFLHTDASVRTSVLSKRWRYVWTKVPVLDFALVDSSNKSSFITFVYKALVLNDAPELKLFRLSNVGAVEDFHVHSWIWSMLRRNVLEVGLCSIDRETKLAEGLFVSEKLRVLKLTGKFILPVSALYFKLPNLEILHLSGVILEDSLLDIPSVFPRLRELALRNWSVMKILNIHSASLRVLKIMYFKLTTEIQDIVIEAPNLEYLSLSDNFSFYDIKDVSSLIEAKINVCKQNCGMLELLCHISGLKTLLLSIATIYQALANVYPHQLPVFHNLTCLELADGTLSFVLHILDHTPNLTSLIVHRHIYSDDWTEYWNPYPYSTPNCLSSTLKVIKFYDFCGAEGQVTMGEYFLRTAGRLRVMKIHTVHRDAEDEMSALLRLFKVPRVSSMCEFTICIPGKTQF